MSKNNKTYYQLILDSSSSMASVAIETMDAFNDQIEAIRRLQEQHPDQEVRVSLTTFDTFIDYTLDRTRPEDVPELSRASYRPRRMTSLLDAMGHSVQRLQAQVGDEIAEDRATAVVVTLTDGYENASKRYSHWDVATMIDQLQGDGSWTFSFLGADIDAFRVASSLGIHRCNTRSILKEDLQKSFDEVNGAMEEHLLAKTLGRKKRHFLD